MRTLIWTSFTVHIRVLSVTPLRTERFATNSTFPHCLTSPLRVLSVVFLFLFDFIPPPQRRFHKKLECFYFGIILERVTRTFSPLLFVISRCGVVGMYCAATQHRKWSVRKERTKVNYLKVY